MKHYIIKEKFETEHVNIRLHDFFSRLVYYGVFSPQEQLQQKYKYYWLYIFLQGDSGGPLMVPLPDNRWVLAGTVSHGIKCAYPDMPGVYMRMTFYKPWIEKVTGLDLWSLLDYAPN